MRKRIEEIAQRLPEGHKDIAVYTDHVFEALDNYSEEHRKLIATNAAHGADPNPDTEKEFRDNIADTKRMMIQVLEKTAQDFEHKGDKYWDKNYDDGIDM
ncbi:hypothetical protein GLW08_11050 [Pontibacillus yanchengensis]|uniref:Uncharacterized protein n=1 Tax=Pontibacillus yanchengensis TaxID=462910 RepID=A0ACC7VFY7_9BACI|nr:hypothetical protein [Pontibacillus yanchengensis]MYL53873.1 hypothetical protein [Pontibacillus yanchengensis]